MKLPAKALIESPSHYDIFSLLRGSALSYMVGFYIFAFYLELHFRIPQLQSIRFQFTYGAIVGACCLVAFFTEKKYSPQLNTVTKYAFALIFFLTLYTVFSMDRASSIVIYSDRGVKFAVVAFFIYAAVRNIEDLRVIIAFMLLAWLKIGQEGFWGWFTGNLVWENQGIPRLHGSTAMFGHPNSFSGFAVGCMPFAIFLLFSVKSYLLRAALITLIFFSLIIIVTTGSRTGYVAIVIGSIYFFMKLKTGKFKVFMLVLLAGILTINLVPEHYKERFESIFTGEEKEGQSSDKRKEIIADAIEIYKTYPLGIGVNAFPYVRSQMFGRSQNTHNLYLEVLTNIGPFGFLVFILFVWHIIKRCIANITILDKLNEPTLNDKLLVNFSKAIIGFMLMRILLGLFGMDLYEIYWWLALGLTLAVTKLTHKRIAES